MMIKCLHHSAPELLILLRLNHRDLRQDPWNPAPHILCAVPRDEHVFLCMQRLVEFNKPPLQTVSNYIDFFKQVLEGLTFLHEHSIAQLSPLDLMVDLGPTTSSAADCIESFDRSRYPVRYYFTNLSNAREFDGRADPAFPKDVADCANMMEQLADKVSSISRKLTTLVNAMRTGTFDADASRKLFEALCKSLPADVFEIRLPSDVLLTGGESVAVVAAPPSPASSSLQTISKYRKPKSTTLSPQSGSQSPTHSLGKVRARSTEALDTLAALDLDI
ncbi:hypothetical protein C8R43DRAFT_1079702 [Mycena crocata]|nr:hypothetical protein C8R43DRAFT_1079702 [Mycena crocata]